MKLMNQKRYDEICNRINELITTDRALLSGRDVYSVENEGFILKIQYETIFVTIAEKVKFE